MGRGAGHFSGLACRETKKRVLPHAGKSPIEIGGGERGEDRPPRGKDEERAPIGWNKSGAGAYYLAGGLTMCCHRCGTLDLTYAWPTSTISPGRTVSKASMHEERCCKTSGRRFDFTRRMRIAIFQPAMSC